MKLFLTALAAVALTGCAALDSAQRVLPKDHDSYLVSRWVDIDLALDTVNCENPEGSRGWVNVLVFSERLARYTEFRDDPQKDNMKALNNHVHKMKEGGSKAFCEMGIKSARSRLDAAKSAWSGR